MTNKIGKSNKNFTSTLAETFKQSYFLQISLRTEVGRFDLFKMPILF